MYARESSQLQISHPIGRFFYLDRHWRCSLCGKPIRPYKVSRIIQKPKKNNTGSINRRFMFLRNKIQAIRRRTLRGVPNAFILWKLFPLRGKHDLWCSRHSRNEFKALRVYLKTRKRKKLATSRQLWRWYRYVWRLSYNAARKLANLLVKPDDLFNFTKRKLIKLLGKVSALKVWQFLKVIRESPGFYLNQSQKGLEA